MRKLSWDLEPQEFVEILRLYRAHWRRFADGSVGRRFSKDVARRRMAWFRRVRGIQSLPKLDVHALSSPLLSESPEEDLFIIVPPKAEADNSASDTSGSKDRRKTMRRLMHRAGFNGEGSALDLVGTNRVHKRLPSIARSRDEKAQASRALYLEALGLAIVPQLLESEIAALEKAGALVARNGIVSVSEPQFETSKTVSAAHLEAVGIGAARERGLDGTDVLIGILDTGIDPTHPEFEGKKIYFRAFGKKLSVSNSAAKDFGHHGTHVSALCAGRTVGVAPKSDLAVAAVLTHRKADGTMTGFNTNILQGLNWLAGESGGLPRSVDIVNASLGSYKDLKSYHEAVWARRNDPEGILVIASIGNEGERGVGVHTAPGSLECAIGVGAIDNDGYVANFSAWGSTHDREGKLEAFKPDLMAPGVDIESAVPGGGYARMSGTSMASPIVTGAGALAIQQDKSLRNDPDRLADALLAASTPLPPQAVDPRRMGRGRLDFTVLCG